MTQRHKQVKKSDKIKNLGAFCSETLVTRGGIEPPIPP